MVVAMEVLKWNETGYSLWFIYNVDRCCYHLEIHIKIALSNWCLPLKMIVYFINFRADVKLGT